MGASLFRLPFWLGINYESQCIQIAQRCDKIQFLPAFLSPLIISSPSGAFATLLKKGTKLVAQ